MPCIKTHILQTVETDIRSLTPLITEVERNPVVLPRHENGGLRPYTCIFDEPETRITINNRYRDATFLLWIETWEWQDIHSDLNDRLDEIHAQILMKMYGGEYLQYVTKVEEVSEEKVFVNENEGAHVNKYDITYRTVFKNPFERSITQ